MSAFDGMDDVLLGADDEELDYDLEQDEEDALLADPEHYENDYEEIETGDTEEQHLDQSDEIEEELPNEEETDVLDIDANVALDEVEEDLSQPEADDDYVSDKEKNDRGRFTNERPQIQEKYVTKQNQVIPDTLDNVNEQQTSVRNITTTRYNNNYHNNNNQRGMGYRGRGNGRGGFGGGPRFNNYNNRSGPETKTVLINPHFQGNIQASVNARLAWDPNNPGSSYNNALIPPQHRFTAQIAPFQQKPQAQLPSPWITPPYHLQQQQQQLQLPPAPPPPSQPQLRPLRPPMHPQFQEPHQSSSMTSWTDAQPEQICTYGYETESTYLPQNNFRDRNEPVVYNNNNNNPNIQQPYPMNFDQRQNVNNMDMYHNNQLRNNNNNNHNQNFNDTQKLQQQQMMMPQHNYQPHQQQQHQQNFVPAPVYGYNQQFHSTFGNNQNQNQNQLPPTQQQQMMPNQMFQPQTSYQHNNYLNNNNVNNNSYPSYEQQQPLPQPQRLPPPSLIHPPNFQQHRPQQQQQQQRNTFQQYGNIRQQTKPLFNKPRYPSPQQQQHHQQQQQQQQQQQLQHYNNMHVNNMAQVQKRRSFDGGNPRMINQDLIMKRKKRSFELSNLHQVTTIDTPDTTTKIEENAVEYEDEETKAYRLKIEEQKRQREEILRKKEERRKLAAAQDAIAKTTTPLPVPLLSIPIVMNNISTTSTVQNTQKFPSGNKPQLQQQQFRPKLLLKKLPQQHQQQQQLQQQQQQLKRNIQPIATRRLLNKNPTNQLTNIVVTQNNQQQMKQQQQQQQQQQRVVLKPGPVNTVMMGTPLNNRLFVSNATPTSSSENNDDLGSFLSNRTVIASDSNVNQIQQESLIQTPVVVVSNLAASTNDMKIRKLCQGFGPIQNIEMIPSTRQATIRFKTILSAHKFFKKNQRKIVDLSMIKVELQPQI